jgi:hypothetical protein
MGGPKPQLGVESEQWTTISGAIGRALKTT